MKILDVRPVEPASGKTIARVDLELPNGIRLYDLRLIRGTNGPRVYGPAIFSGSAVTFPIALADQIAKEAVAYVGTAT